MDWFVKGFIKASLAWLGLGVTLGVVIAAYPQYIIYRPAHVHMNLLGFVTMMIFGVAYHVLPRFSGNPLYSRRLAGVHWWLSQAGLTAMVAGFFALPHVGRPGRYLLAFGGVTAMFGAYAFVYGIWRTLDGPRKLRDAQARAMGTRGTPLPVSPR